MTIEGNPARMAPGGMAFEGWTNLATGPNTVTIAATDENANTTTQNYEVEVAGGSTRTLTYDDNGNLHSDGIRTYEWDARDRLLTIQKSGDWRTEFTYDGLDRRVKLKDIDISGTPSTIREVAFLWNGLSIQEERNATGSTVQKRYFNNGMEILSGPNSGEYLYHRDHLGSIREMTDNDISATVRARYDFDLWGIRSANIITANPVEADFAFTGHFFIHSLTSTSPSIACMIRPLVGGSVGIGLGRRTVQIFTPIAAAPPSIGLISKVLANVIMPL